MQSVIATFVKYVFYLVMALNFVNSQLYRIGKINYLIRLEVIELFRDRS